MSMSLSVVGGASVSVSVLVATRGTATANGSHAVVTGPDRRSLETTSVVTRTAVSRASVWTMGHGRALVSALLPPVHEVVAASVEGSTRRAVHGPRRTAASRTPTEAVDMGRAMGRAARPCHTPHTGPTSTKTLARARATLSPASRGADGLAFDEPELYQAVRAHTERAQQGPSLPRVEVDAASNQGGVNGTLFVASAIAVGLHALDDARADVVDVVDAGAVVVVRAVRGLLLLLLLLDVLRAAVGRVVAAAAHQRASFSLAHRLLALTRAVTSQDQRREAVFQKPPRC